MANCSRGRIPRPQIPSAPPEPVMRRWPHPVEDTGATPGPDAGLYYVRCALSYQNQLLADIKALLQQILVAQESSPEE